jgi:two-component system cell cycle response regulator DivK
MNVMEKAADIENDTPAPDSDVLTGTKGAGKTILIVDDDADTRWLLGHLLKSAGYEVQTADYAEKAMILLYTLRPDAVLMDIRLPGMDGLQLTRLIQLTSSKKVPIVAVSAGENEFSVQAAYEAGCDGYIAKPVNMRTFAATVGQYLGK